LIEEEEEDGEDDDEEEAEEEDEVEADTASGIGQMCHPLSNIRARTYLHVHVSICITRLGLRR
jgi:hypothetical protein